MLERYKSKEYPAEFPCRTKCIVLFQNIDGQDTLLFGMYVYEYGHNCPQPNQRRCYVSYLDSVHYFRPKQYRTVVYHEILVAYLEYMKARGFHTAHIWACPPLKGDDYILYCHPSDQKTPKDDKLRKWYVDMLDECKTRGIMEDITDIYAEYLADPSLDATVLPYFEGDYWVSEAEVIIKDIGHSGGGVVSDSVLDDPTEVNDKSKRKTSTRKGRTSRGSGGAALQTSTKIDRDPVMAKLASIIEPMKEAFFVCRMHPKEFAASYAAKLQAELDAANSTAAVATEKIRDEELKAEALSGNDVSLRSEVSGTDGDLKGNNSSTSAQTQPASEAVAASRDDSQSKMDIGVIESKEDTDVEPPKAAEESTRSGVSEDAKHVKPWHSPEHAAVRHHIIDLLVRIKREKNVNANPTEEWLRQLMEDAKRHENIMYLHAPTFEVTLLFIFLITLP
jgi:hypothetical protein